MPSWDLLYCLQEIMRLYPVAGGATFRHSKNGKDVALRGGDFILPAGVNLHMSVAAIHHAKDIWEEPYSFKPERFLEVDAHPEINQQPCVLVLTPTRIASPYFCPSASACRGFIVNPWR